MPVTYQSLIGGNKHLMAEGICAIRLIIKHCFAPFWVFLNSFECRRSSEPPGRGLFFESLHFTPLFKSMRSSLKPPTGSSYKTHGRILFRCQPQCV